MEVRKIRDGLYEATIIINNVRHSCLGATEKDAVNDLNFSLSQQGKSKKEGNQTC